jgi:murein DD-endopeptidase MepM/ murein hydrolase activator NlpD
MKDQFVRVRDRSVGLGIIALACSTLVFAIKSTKDSGDLKALREQNKILSKQISNLEASFESVRKYTGSADALATPGLRPKVMDFRQYNADSNVKKPFDFLFKGVSLAAKSGIDNILEDKGRSDVDMFADLVTRVDNLSQDTDSIVGRLRGLAVILRHNKNLMRTIPSIQPVEGRVTSNFGWRLSPFEGKRHMHGGIDIAAETGDIVSAPADGVVTFVGNFETLGQTIVISHGNGVISRYGHLSKFMIRKGASVKRGQSIGQVGSTGRSTGPHLHYEIWIRNNPVNPADFFYDLDGADQVATSESPKSRKHLVMNGMGGEQ